MQPCWRWVLAAAASYHLEDGSGDNIRERVDGCSRFRTAHRTIFETRQQSLRGVRQALCSVHQLQPVQSARAWPRCRSLSSHAMTQRLSPARLRFLLSSDAHETNVLLCQSAQLVAGGVQFQRAVVQRILFLPCNARCQRGRLLDRAFFEQNRQDAVALGLVAVSVGRCTL